MTTTGTALSAADGISLPPALQAVFTAWVDGDVDAAVACYADEFVATFPSAILRSDKGALRERFTLSTTNFSHRRLHTTHLLGLDERWVVAYERHMSRTDGSPVVLPATAFLTTVDGRITSWREEFDTAKLFRSLVDAAVAPTELPQQPPIDLDRLPAGLQQMLRSLCAFDVDAYVASFADGFVCEEPVSGRTTDPTELRTHVEVSERNWSSFTIEVTDLLVDGSWCGLEYVCVLEGRSGPFEGLTVRLPCNVVVRFAEDGRIALWHEEYDTNVFRRALKPRG